MERNPLLGAHLCVAEHLVAGGCTRARMLLYQPTWVGGGTRLCVSNSAHAIVRRASCPRPARVRCRVSLWRCVEAHWLPDGRSRNWWTNDSPRTAFPLQERWG
eukprot:gene2206-biopygen14020